MRPAIPFDAVLCDLDGVLRRWDPDRMGQWDLAYGLPAGTLARTAFAPARLLPAITGAHTDEQWRSGIVSDLTPQCGSHDRARALVADWSTAVGEIDREVADLLARARKSLPVILVSNATTRLEQDLDRLGVGDLVDDVVNSARVGCAKPDPRIYRLAAERAQVATTRCLFVDDLAENVEAARELGMTGVWFQQPRQLRDALAPFLLDGQ